MPKGRSGPLDTLNPVLAASSSELSASHLLFSSLFDYDSTGAIRPDLATSIETADAKTYVIHLRPHLKWSDGQAFTSADVAYTVGLIQNDDVRSPLAAGFRTVAVTTPDALTLRMELPSAYAPFVHALTFGILPQHVLNNVNPADIRSNGFNFSPVTLGPFTFSSYRASDANGNATVYLAANPNYFRGAPRVDRFQLHVYKDQPALLRAYQRREVTAIAGASRTSTVTAVKQRSHTTVTNVPLDDGDYALFNTKSPLYADPGLRAAIRQGTDLAALRTAVGKGTRALDGPVLASEVPGVAALKQTVGDVPAARAALDTLGWHAGSNGVRSKDGQPLQLRLVAIDTGDYPAIARELSRQWRTLGIDVQLSLQPTASVSEQVLIPRAYDVLVYELAIGADPDVYAYWQSSQDSQSGLNFSGYSSVAADDNLVSARAVLDPSLRAAKYVAFTKQWLADTPAIALFQQSYRYVSGDDAVAVTPNTTLVTPADRFADVNDWTVDSARFFTTP